MASRWAGAQPAWSVLWDFGFIASWGYLLARAASRAFAWLAGARDAEAGLPAWRWLGMAPLAAVGGDVVENLLTLAALAMHGLATDLLAGLCVWLAGAAAWLKVAGLLACLPLLALRLRLALPGVPSAGAPNGRRRPA